MKLFGYEITSSKKDSQKELYSFAPPQSDGEYLFDIGGGSFYNPYSSDKDFQNENKLIMHYRKMSLVPEVEDAIDSIVDEAIVLDEEISLDLSEVESIGENTKKVIHEEFDNILNLLNWSYKGDEIFRRYYVEGRIYFHKIIDMDKPKKGIQEIRPLDSLNIKKNVEIIREHDKETGQEIVKRGKEFYTYSPYNNAAGYYQAGMVITKDSITYANCGIFDERRTMALSPLHKAIKPLNMLTQAEDHALIYRMTRSTEKRAFYIDVGNLPNKKAEGYLKNTMARFKNRIRYNSKTGEVSDQNNEMAITEDFWFARREGGKGTEVTTLQGGANINDINDIEYLYNKFLDSLKIPKSRRDPSAAFTLGRSSEITRDELKFSKFIRRIRKRFSEIFFDLLYTQLVLKQIITEDEWFEIKDQIKLIFPEDSHFAELKEAELTRERISLVREMQEFAGKYYSHEYIRRFALQQTDEDVEEMDKQIEDEKDKYAEEEPEDE